MPSTDVLSTDVFSLARSGLNDFLYAKVGAGADGGPVTVLSALARLGLDPWQEAGRLAGLSRPAAADSLARLIAAMPAPRRPAAEARAIAARLVLLLPGAAAAGRDAPRPSRPRAPRPGGRRWALILIVLLGAAAAVMTLPRAEPVRTETR
jgi:hypothetical protein